MGRGRLMAAVRAALPLLVIAAVLLCASAAWAATSVSGTAYSAVTGQGASGIRVDAYRYDSLYGDWEIWDSTLSAANGTYAFSDLPDNTYRIGFFDPNQDYREQYWNGQPSVTVADAVVVSAGTPVTGIDATMQGLTPGITGHVTAAVGGMPVDGALVRAYAFDGSSWVETGWPAWSAPDGSYQLYLLGDGTYRVGASDPVLGRFGGAFYGGATVDAGADVVTSSGLTTSSVDIALPAEITAPGVTATVEPSYVAPALISMTGSDAGSGVLSVSYVLDSDTTVTVPGSNAVADVRTLGSHTVTYWATDRAGNQSVHYSATFDVVAPPPPAVSTDATSVYSGSARIKVRGLDNGGAGIDSVSYRIDGDATQTTSAYSAYATTSAIGSHTLEYWSTDILGTDSTHAFHGFEVVPLPAVFSDARPTYATTADVRITGIDNGGAGVVGLSYVLDGDTTQTVSASATDVVTSILGSHTLEFWSVDALGGESAHANVGFRVFSPYKAVRISGVDRYDAAVRTALTQRPRWSGVHNIVLTSGEDRYAAETLSAPGLSWAYRGVPILLTGSRSTPLALKRAVLGAVNANGAITLRIVGGSKAVPSARVEDLRRFVAREKHWSMAKASKMVRLDRVSASDDRYKIAGAVAVRMATARRDFPRRALVIDGSTSRLYLDAAALGPVSAHTGAPILLVSATKVPAATSAAIKKARVRASGIFVYGSPTDPSGAVSRSLGSPGANRVVGASSAERAAHLADAALARGWLGRGVAGVASSRSEALVAAPLLASGSGGPLLLTASGALPAETDAWLSARSSALGRVWVLGGTWQVSSSVFDEIGLAIH